MYESSSLTIIYKYLFPPVWSGVIIAGFLLPSGNTDQPPVDDFWGFLVLFGTVMIWLIILSVRLRRVMANSSHLTIFSFHGNKRIAYKDIQYVSEAALVNPRLISISYLESETGESDIILVIPSTTSEMFRFKFLKEHDMTQYIREQIIIHNPEYSTKREPSRWQTLGLVTLSLMGAALISHAILSGL